VTGRKSLFLAAHAGAILGWTIPEARIFLRDLTEHATRPEFVYSHEWRPYDLVMWDNRQTIHRARRFNRNEVRDAAHHPRRRRAVDRIAHVTDLELTDPSGGAVVEAAEKPGIFISYARSDRSAPSSWWPASSSLVSDRFWIATTSPPPKPGRRGSAR
jgi:hypothetical protein